MRLRPQLEQRVCEAPDEWAPWLVFADWLAENEPDDVRSRMILLGHQLANEPLSKAETRRLEREIMELEGRKTWRSRVGHWESLERVALQHGFLRRATFWGRHAGRAFVEVCRAGEAWLLEEIVFEPSNSEDMALLAASERLDGFAWSHRLMGPQSDTDGTRAARVASERLLHIPRWFEFPRQRREYAKFVVWRPDRRR